MKKSRLTKKQLSERLNVSHQAATKWEAGSGLSDIKNLKKISSIFHISTNLLLDNGI